MYNCIQCGRRMSYIGICRSCRTSLTGGLEDISRDLKDAMEIYRSQEALARDLRNAVATVKHGGMDGAITATQLDTNSVLDFASDVNRWQGLESREVEHLTRHLREGLDAVSRQAELATFKPRIEELAAMVAQARPAWDALLQSPTLGYAFAAIAALREGIEQAPFAENTIAALHSQLGDWHNVGLTAELFDQKKRQEAYLRAGMDRRLVNVEPRTFDALLDATQLRPATPPPLRRAHISADLDEVPEVEEIEEVEKKKEELEQAVKDYRRLYQFEAQIRAFVDEVLTTAAGPTWTKQRVPDDCLRSWRERRSKDREARKQVHPLVNYADLGDWPKIIRRKDNWPLFQPFFNRATFVEESFNRLIPLRNDIAHMRPLTGADRLVFYVEIHQLSMATRGPQGDDEDFDLVDILQ